MTIAPVVFAGAPAAGQIQVLRPLPPPEPSVAGMVHDGDGWRNPTLDEALRLLGMDREREAWTFLYGQNVHRPAVAILRQELETRSESELDEFAREVADMILADTTWLGRARQNAGSALRGASRADYNSYGGTPHRGSFDELVRVYEITAALVLEETGGTDPFLEASRSDKRYDNLDLLAVYFGDPGGRGRNYVLGVQRGSAKPPPCILPARRDDEPWPEFCEQNYPWETTWCRAGKALYRETVDAAIERRYGRVGRITTRSNGPLAVEGLPEAAAEWWSVCWIALW